MPKRRKHRKKGKKAPPPPVEDGSAKISKCLVFKNGKVGITVRQLIMDLRRIMLPNTAPNLKERKSNTLKDFLSVAGPLGVTHFLILSATEKATYLKMARTPRGPTLTFRLHQYSLMTDIAHLQQHPHSPGTEYNTPPLVVLSNFKGEEKHVKLMAVMFQNIFPAINVQLVKIPECRRVVLFDYNPSTKLIEMRHYLIKVQPVGLSKSIKRLVQSNIPELGQFEDISEYVLRGANASESDVEEGDEGKVMLPSDINNGNKTPQQSAVRLIELGPRIELQLIKIEEELCSGDVIFHEYVQKTPEEARKLKELHQRKKAEKEKRKKEQEANVKRKQGELEEDKEDNQNDIDDAEYYRQEVGEEPDPELFSGAQYEAKKERFNPLYRKRKRDDKEGSSSKNNNNNNNNNSFKNKGKRNFKGNNNNNNNNNRNRNNNNKNKNNKAKKARTH